MLIPTAALKLQLLQFELSLSSQDFNTHVQYLQQLIHYTYVAVDQIPAPWAAASSLYFSIKTSSSNLLLHSESRLDKPTYFPRDFCLGIAELYIIYGW